VGNQRRHILSKALGPLEEQIMEVTWRASDVGIHEVYEAVQEGQPIAYATVATTMYRLTRKGFLDHGTRRAHRFTARITREQYAHSIAEYLVNWLVTHFPDHTVAYFVDRAAEDEEVIKHLRLEIARRRSSDESRRSPSVTGH
jgi:predicted transcriptional regulator